MLLFNERKAKHNVVVEWVSLDKTGLSLHKGKTCRLIATVYPRNATNKTLTWRSSNTDVATVIDGVVYAKENGIAIITVESTDGSCVNAYCSVTVNENVLINSIDISPASRVMEIGETACLYLMMWPTNATNRSVDWESTDTYVATVNPTNGLVVARGEGTATIYASARDGSGKFGCCTIRVVKNREMRRMEDATNWRYTPIRFFLEEDDFR